MPRPRSPEVSLVMPCYNEEACLRPTAHDLLLAFEQRGLALELVLVDNGSLDRTPQIIDELIAEGHPIKKVTVAVNQGYGHGILEGLQACTAPFVGYLCADGQVAAAEAATTFEQARDAGVPILAKVRRRFRKDSWRRKVVSVLYNVGMQFVFGWFHSIDLNASPKIFPRDALRLMQLESKDWFLDPELMIKAKHIGLRVLERDVEGLARAGGKSNVRVSTCLQFLHNIAAWRFGPRLGRWKRSVRQMPAIELRAMPGVAAPQGPVAR
jgi:glycosyltransferase involved in cell wall biosynthesis